MPNKEILRVEIDDSEFSEFKKKFDAYEFAVKALPGEWQKSGTEITAHKTQFEEMASSIRGQAQELANLASAQEKIGAVLEGTGIALAGMAKSGVHFAGSIFQATASLRHWTKLTALFGGLIGAGGLFGIAAMSASVARQRSSAAGLGVTYGEQASFLTNFGRLPNAAGLLQGFSEAETNIGKKYALSQYLGHGGSGDPARDFAEGLLRFKDLVDRTPKEMLGPALQQRGYDKLGLTPETALAVKSIPRSEIEQISHGYGADLATRLGLDPGTAKKWTEFTTKLEKAGEDIDTVLWKGLGKLTKPLEHLSEGFEHLVSALFRDGSPISEWIKKAGHGISVFADTLGSGATQAKAAQLSNDIAAAARFFEAVVARFPQGLAVLLGMGAAARYGGPAAVAIGEGLAGTALGTGAAVVGAGAALGAGVEAGANKLDPAGWMRRHAHPAWAKGGATPPIEDERARQAAHGQGPWQGPMQPEAQGPWQGPPMPPHPMPKGVFPKMEPAKPGSLSSKPAVGFDTSEAVKANPAHAVDLAMSKVGETINDSDIQTYLRTGHHPDPAKQSWCAMFVGASLTKAGVRDSGSDVATSYARWGRAVDPHDVHRGDVYVRTRGHRPGETGGHVGLLTGESRYVHGREQVEMISGNSGPRPRHVRKTWEPVGGTNVIRRAEFGHIGHHPATVSHAQHTTMIEDQSGGMVSVTGGSSNYGWHPNPLGGERFRHAADFYRARPEHFQPMSGNVEDRRFEGPLRGGLLPNVPDAPLSGHIAKRLSGPGRPLGAAHHPSGLPPIEKSVDDYLNRMQERRDNVTRRNVPTS